MEYEIIKTDNKTWRVEVLKNGKVIYYMPKNEVNNEVDRFVDSKSNWVKQNISCYETQKQILKNLIQLDDNAVDEMNRQACEVIPKRVEYYANIMGETYSDIKIRCYKSKWGSCSSKKKLVFNSILMLAPDEIIDYVVVHELSHLKQMNHSKAFWAEVEKVMPNYKECESWLKANGRYIMHKIYKPNIV